MSWTRRSFIAAGLASAVAGCGRGNGGTPAEDQTETGPEASAGPPGPDPAPTSTPRLETVERAETVQWGTNEDQVADLYVPGGAVDAPGRPVVVLLHGGFWHRSYGRLLMAPLALDLAARQYVAWNVEYRGVEDEAGGWPGTLDDVAQAIDHLASLRDDALDLDRVAVVGHSAGGHLALWAAARHRVQAGAPGSDPVVRPTVAVSQAGIPDLARCARDGLAEGACTELLGGGPDEVPDRYAAASPAQLLPLGVSQVVVHGGADQSVPLAYSRDWAVQARAAGDTVDLVELAGVDHFAPIDPSHAAWQAVVRRLDRLL